MSITREDVTSLFRDLRNAIGSDGRVIGHSRALDTVREACGADSISDIPESKLDEVAAALKEALKKNTRSASARAAATNDAGISRTAAELDHEAIYAKYNSASGVKSGRAE